MHSFQKQNSAYWEHFTVHIRHCNGLCKDLQPTATLDCFQILNRAGGRVTSCLLDRQYRAYQACLSDARLSAMLLSSLYTKTHYLQAGKLNADS